MYGKKCLLVFILWLVSTVCYSQNYTYSFTDPCTGIVKTLAVPNNGIPITLYGQTRTFTPSDFISGNVDLWLNSVINSFGGSNPCATLVGTPNAINIAQTTTLQFITIVNNLSAVSDMAGSVDLLSNLTSATSNSESKKDKKDKKSSNSTTESNSNQANNTISINNTTNGSTTTTNSNDKTNSVNSTASNSSNSNNTTNNTKSSDNNSSDNVGNSTNQDNTDKTTTTNTTTTSTSTSNKGEINKTTNTTTTNEDKSNGGNVNIVGSSINSVQSVSSESKNGNRPTILASSDLVGFNFKNTDVNYGGKFSGSYTSTRWDGLRSHGILGDYTTAIKGPNIAGFYAFLHKKRIDLISTSLTVGFDSKISVYGTLAAGQMWKFKKPKSLKLVYLVTTSCGKVYGEKFVGTAFIAGGMYDWKVSKRIDVKLLGLYVYAPYVRYYNDVLLKSPNVVLPIIGTNIGITKRFKLNVNMGGAYAININTLNYTIMMGTRLLL